MEQRCFVRIIVILTYNQRFKASSGHEAPVEKCEAKTDHGWLKRYIIIISSPPCYLSYDLRTDVCPSYFVDAFQVRDLLNRDSCSRGSCVESGQGWQVAVGRSHPTLCADDWVSRTAGRLFGMFQLTKSVVCCPHVHVVRLQRVDCIPFLWLSNFMSDCHNTEG